MKIYTKTGDEGETGLLGGDRISKSSLRISVVGTLDELNAWIGLSLLHELPSLVQLTLQESQSLLFDIGAEIACPPGGKFDITSVQSTHIARLEGEIDWMDEKLPNLKNFILPGGTSGASHLHYARAVCRRLERSLIELHHIEPVRAEVLQFANRLSDWMFTASRFSNHQANVTDVPWKKLSL